jgi:alkylated DNA repair dioxygenase AlkB
MPKGSLLQRKHFDRRYVDQATINQMSDLPYRVPSSLKVDAPMPAIVYSLRKRAEALSGASFNSVLLNLYRNGRDSVGWHSDYEAGLGERRTIASLSLGGATNSIPASQDKGNNHA